MSDGSPMKTKLSEAVDLLCRELNADEDYRRSWSANIAMAFFDEFRKATDYRVAGEHRNMLQSDVLHRISNNAAERFLGVLCADRPLRSNPEPDLCPDCRAIGYKNGIRCRSCDGDGSLPPSTVSSGHGPAHGEGGEEAKGKEGESPHGRAISPKTQLAQTVDELAARVDLATEHEVMRQAWIDFPTQDNEGYRPERGGFKTGWNACRAAALAALKYARPTRKVRE